MPGPEHDFEHVIGLNKEMKLIVTNDKYGLSITVGTIKNDVTKVIDRVWITHDRDTGNIIIER